MHIIKKSAAAILILVMVITMAACHNPDETVLKTGDFEIKPGVYLALLISAQFEFINNVDALIEEDEDATAPTSIDEYYAQKLDDKDYNTWVTDKTLEYAQNFAATYAMFEENGLELTEEEISSIESSANSAWDSYQEFYESNGIFYDSYYKTVEQGTMANKLFNFFYKEGGSADIEKVTEQELKQALDDNFVLVNSITESFQDETTKEADEDLKTEIKDKLDKYADRINKGEAFADIKKENDILNGEDAEDEEDSDSSDTSGPKDKNASLIGGENTSYPDENFDTLKALKVGEATVVTPYENYYMLAVRKDVLEDPYYLEQYEDTLLQILKADEFSELIKSYAAGLSTWKNNSLIKYYSPKKTDISSLLG